MGMPVVSDRKRAEAKKEFFALLDKLSPVNAMELFNEYLVKKAGSNFDSEDKKSGIVYQRASFVVDQGAVKLRRILKYGG